MSYTPSDVSVIICTHTDERWDDLVAAVESAQRQEPPPSQVIVVVDHNPGLLQRVREFITGVIATANTGARGVSEARNSGVAVSNGNILVFLDDDAIALPGWLAGHCTSYENAAVLGVGGSIEPMWLDGKPSWFPEEFNWAVGGSYKGMPQVKSVVRNVFSGNMSIRRDVFESIGGFRSGFGKVGARSCPEDTDLCIRANQKWRHGIWLYEPKARIQHRVPGKRATLKYFLWRSYNEGWGKAHLSKLVGRSDGMSAEYRHAFVVLPQGVLRGFAETFFRRDLSGVARSAAILVGLVWAAVGYLGGLNEVRTHRLVLNETLKVS